jgi:hypothetical protein
VLPDAPGVMPVMRPDVNAPVPGVPDVCADAVVGGVWVKTAIAGARSLVTAALAITISISVQTPTTTTTTSHLDHLL